MVSACVLYLDKIELTMQKRGISLEPGAGLERYAHYEVSDARRARSLGDLWSMLAETDCER